MKHVRRILSLSFAALLIFVSPVVAQQKVDDAAKNSPSSLASVRKQLKWDEPAEPSKLVGPIYFVGTKGLSVFLITGSQGHIVLNTGMPGSGPMIEKSIRQLGFKPEDVKILLTGHAHVDHVGGHAYLKQKFGTKIVMIREEKELFESGGKLDFHYGADMEFQFEPAKVDSVFNDGDEIKLGDITLKALLTNGHTRGSTTFLMNVIDNGKAYSVAFPNGTSINPGYRVVVNPSYPGIADDLKRTVTILEALQPDIWFYAHNETHAYDAKLARSAKDGVKAWVDPEGYAKWVAAAKAKLEASIAGESRR